MDLAKFSINEKPVKFELEFDGEKTGAVFELVGTDSKEYKAVDSEINNEILKLGSKRGKLDLSSVTTERSEVYTNRRLAACIVGWSGVEYKGNELEYSHENALLLVSELPFVKEEITRFVTDRRNFMNA